MVKGNSCYGSIYCQEFPKLCLNPTKEKYHTTDCSLRKWLNFPKALRENEKLWSKNRNPEFWTSRIINNALQKVVGKPQLNNGGEKVKQRGQKSEVKDVKSSSERRMFFCSTEVTSACN